MAYGKSDPNVHDDYPPGSVRPTIMHEFSVANGDVYTLITDPRSHFNRPALLQLGAVYDPNRKGYSIAADRPELQEITKGIEAITWYPLGPNAGDAYDKLKQLAVKNNQVPLYPSNANPRSATTNVFVALNAEVFAEATEIVRVAAAARPDQAERIAQLVALGELDEHHFHRDEKSIGFLSRLKEGNVTRGEANALLAKVEPACALYETATLDRWDKQLAEYVRNGKITAQSVILPSGEPFVNVYNDRHDEVFTQLPAEQLLEAVNKGRKGATTQQRQQVCALVAMGALDSGRIDQVNLTEYDAKRSIETGKLYYSQPEIEKYLAENAQDGHELTPNSLKERDRQDQQKWLDAQIQEAKLLQISEAAVEKPLPTRGIVAGFVIAVAGSQYRIGNDEAIYGFAKSDVKFDKDVVLSDLKGKMVGIDITPGFAKPLVAIMNSPTAPLAAAEMAARGMLNAQGGAFKYIDAPTTAVKGTVIGYAGGASAVRTSDGIFTTLNENLGLEEKPFLNQPVDYNPSGGGVATQAAPARTASKARAGRS